MADKCRRNEFSLPHSLLANFEAFIQQNPSMLFRLPEVRNEIVMARLDSVDLDQMETTDQIDPAAVTEAFEYNKEMLRNIANHPQSLLRPKLLIEVLSNISYIYQHRGEMKVLCVGPRTEAEFFMLLGEGFNHQNLTGLDLMSYSEFVDVGDMHAMPYDDNSFDIVFLGWVLTYSKDMQQVANECIRVAKPGAYVAVGVEAEPHRDDRSLYGHTLSDAPNIDTTDEIVELFEGYVYAVPFRHDVHRSKQGKEVDHVMVVMELD